MEAGAASQGGSGREIAEETSLITPALDLLGVYGVQRINRGIIACIRGVLISGGA